MFALGYTVFFSGGFVGFSAGQFLLLFICWNCLSSDAEGDDDSISGESTKRGKLESKPINDFSNYCH